MRSSIVAFLLLASTFASVTFAQDPWLKIAGNKDGDLAGKGKRVVLIAGDEEYRSEEALPQLGKILARHHGFDAVVLFPINPTSGLIDPNYSSNIPGLEQLAGPT